MAKPKRIFRCTTPGCGHSQPMFFGMCPKCEEAGTAEEVDESSRHERVAHSVGTAKPATFTDVRNVKTGSIDRIPSGLPELDRVLGGGLVPSSYLVLAGEPGAGKTTMASEILLALAREGLKVGYVSGEESVAQAQLRFKRLAGDQGIPEGVNITTETSIEAIAESAAAEGYDFLVVDSVQTTYSEQLPGAPGTLSQVRESGQKLMRVAKDHGVSILLVGQVTKGGDMAGPRNLEHMVDVVLQFEGDRREQYRILRAVKNRFGATDEIGVFEMTGSGLVGISDPSQLFLEEGDSGLTPGATLSAVIEGTRPIICEVQALVAPTNSPQPTRAVRGFDRNRAQMLLAVLQRKCRLRLGAMDVYINVSGGMKVDEPGADLAVCLAVASVAQNRPLKQRYCAFGEVTLLGNVRPAAQNERRRKEAERLGLTPFDGAGSEPLKEIIESALGQPVDDAPEEEAEA